MNYGLKQYSDAIQTHPRKYACIGAINQSPTFEPGKVALTANSNLAIWVYCVYAVYV